MQSIPMTLSTNNAENNPRNYILQRSIVFPYTFIITSGRKRRTTSFPERNLDENFCPPSLSRMCEYTYHVRTPTKASRGSHVKKSGRFIYSTNFQADEDQTAFALVSFWYDSISLDEKSKIFARDRKPIDWRKYIRCTIAVFGRKTHIDSAPFAFDMLN